MNSYREEALEILLTFPASEARNGMEELVRYTTDRKY
jgi:octaprenyl-diphosphate synthase